MSAVDPRRISLTRGLGLVLASVVLLCAAGPARGATTNSSAGRGVAPDAAVAADPAPSAITFAEISVGTTVTDQYLAEGVIFTTSPFTVDDGASYTNPTLSGTPLFEGPIGGRFTAPGTEQPQGVDGFSMDIGYINNRNSVEVQYFDAAGQQLGAVKAQVLGFNHITVHAAGIVSFLVHTISEEDAGYEIDNLTIERDAQGIRPTRMASLGDSYSSGEGLLPENGMHYDCGTDLLNNTYYRDSSVPYGFYSYFLDGYDCDTRTGAFTEPRDFYLRDPVHYQNKCHRHGRAYPNQIREMFGIAASNAIFMACSGAVTDDVLHKAQYPNSPVNVAGGRPQIDTLAGFAAGGAPDFITIGIGGNDAGFKDLIVHCMTHACAEDPDYTAGELTRVNGDMFRNVRATFKALRAAYPAATIAAFGYPSVIGDPADNCVGVDLKGWKIEQSEREWIKDDVLPAINDAISDAAAEAGVSYVDITAATKGHELCTRDPYINGLRAGVDDGWLPVASESFHPNQYGHDAIASWFMAHEVDHGRLLLVNPAPSEPLRPPTGPEIHLGTLEGTVGACDVTCAQPANACVQACAIHLQGDGYAPGSTVQITLHSDPVSLGTAPIDGAGHLDTTVQIPFGTEIGVHALEISGTAPDGELQYGDTVFELFATQPASHRPAAPPRGNATPPSAAPAPPAAPIVGASAKPLAVSAGGHRRQRLVRRALTVTCRTPVAATCRATATVKIGHVTLRARAVRAVRAGRRVSLTLRFSRKDAKRIVARLRHHTIKVRVVVTATAGARRGSAALTVTLRRAP